MRNLPALFFGSLLSLLATGTLAAEDRGQIAQLAVIELAKETVDCAAYFDIVSLALLHSADEGTAQKYLAARKTAVARAESLNKGVVNDYYNNVLQKMTNAIVIANIKKTIKKDLSNLTITDITVLGDKYSKLCKEVMDSPGNRAKFWTEHLSQEAH